VLDQRLMPRRDPRWLQVATVVLGIVFAPMVWPRAAGAQLPCPTDETELVRVSEDSIGTLPLFDRISQLAARCRSSSDTVFVGPSGRRYPARVFHFQDLSALAVQYDRTALDPNRPPDGWIVTGRSGLLPGAVSMSSSWSVLLLAYGNAQASNRGALVIRFCRLPRILLTMDVDSALLEMLGEPVDLATIPPSVTIHHLLIVSPELGRAFEGC